MLLQDQRRQQPHHPRVGARAGEDASLQERRRDLLRRPRGAQAEEEALALDALDGADKAGLADALREGAHLREEARLLAAAPDPPPSCPPPLPNPPPPRGEGRCIALSLLLSSRREGPCTAPCLLPDRWRRVHGVSDAATLGASGGSLDHVDRRLDQRAGQGAAAEGAAEVSDT